MIEISEKGLARLKEFQYRIRRTILWNWYGTEISLAVKAYESKLPKSLAECDDLGICGHDIEAYARIVPELKFCPICGQRIWRDYGTKD